MQRIQSKLICGLLLLMGMVGFTSCLKSDLPELPLWEGNGIDHIYVEYRFNTDQLFYGEPVVGYQRLVTSDVVVDSVHNTIRLKIAVPNAAGTFTAEDRDAVSQNHLWVYMDVPTGATVAPVAPTPAPGYATDLTKPQTYEVTAANGDTRRWTVEVTEFTK